MRGLIIPNQLKIPLKQTRVRKIKPVQNNLSIPFDTIMKFHSYLRSLLVVLLVTSSVAYAQQQPAALDPNKA